jgi:hypothetical protein
MIEGITRTSAGTLNNKTHHTQERKEKYDEANRMHAGNLKGGYVQFVAQTALSFCALEREAGKHVHYAHQQQRSAK